MFHCWGRGRASEMCDVASAFLSVLLCRGKAVFSTEDTNFVIFSEAYKSEADGQHAGMA